MQINTSKIALPLRHIVAIYQILFGCTFDKIKWKTSIIA